jgi:hypothetical protein
LVSTDIEIIVSYTMEHGIDAVNEKLRRKYKGHDLTAFEREYSVRNGTPAFHHQNPHQSIASGRSSGSSMPSMAPDTAPQARTASLLRMLLSKHDPDKLMSEGVSSMVKWAHMHSAAELDQYLSKEYNVTLKATEEFADNLSESLHVFLRYYDPTMSGVRAVLQDAGERHSAVSASDRALDSLHALVSWAYSKCVCVMPSGAPRVCDSCLFIGLSRAP